MLLALLLFIDLQSSTTSLGQDIVIDFALWLCRQHNRIQFHGLVVSVSSHDAIVGEQVMSSILVSLI